MSEAEEIATGLAPGIRARLESEAERRGQACAIDHATVLGHVRALMPDQGQMTSEVTEAVLRILMGDQP